MDNETPDQDGVQLAQATENQYPVITITPEHFEGGRGTKTHPEVEIKGQPETTPPPKSDEWSLAASPFVGINRGIASGLGLPVDVATWVANRAIELGGGRPDYIKEPIGGSESIRRAMGIIGANPNAPEHLPRNQVERYIQSTGEGVGGMLGPSAGLAAGKALVGAGRNVLGAIVPGVAPKTAAAVEGALPGVAEVSMPGRSVAERVAGAGEAAIGTPKTWGDVSSMMLFGGAGGAGEEVGHHFFPESKIAPVYGGLLGGFGAIPFVAAASALPKIAGATADYFRAFTPEGQRTLAARKILGEATSPEKFKKDVEAGYTQNVPGSELTSYQAYGDAGIGQLERKYTTTSPEDFLAIREQQNAARVAELERLRTSADPSAVPTFLRRQAQEADAILAAAEKSARDQAERHVAGLEGQNRFEEYGKKYREVLQQYEDAAKEVRKNAYDAVDPDGTLGVVAVPFRERVSKFYENLPKAAKPPSGEERDILSLIVNQADVTPFRELTEIDKRLTAAITAEFNASGRSPTWGRLTQMKEAVGEALDNVAQNLQKYEAGEIAAGRMSVYDSIEARARQRWGLPPAEDAVMPPMALDAAATDRYNAAKRAHAQYKSYSEGPVGAVLEKGQRGQYEKLDAEVVPLVFQAGPKGYEIGQQFRLAMGNDPQGISIISDAVASTLARLPRSADGTINPKAFDAWLAKHQDALRAYPEIAPRLTNAADASRMLQEAALRRKTLADEVEKSALGNVMNVNPQEVDGVVRSIIQGGDSVSNMQQVATAVSGNKAAQDGLKTAFADYMLNRFSSQAEAGTSGVRQLNADGLQKFIRQYAPVLSQIYSKEEMASLNAIARDLQQANRSLTTKLPGTPGTAQDVAAAAAPAAASAFRETAGAAARMLALPATGAFAYGPLGAIAGAGAYLTGQAIHRMHEAGMRSVQDIIKESLKNPYVMEKTLRGIVLPTSREAGVSIPQNLVRHSMYTTGSNITQPEPVARKSGGRVGHIDHASRASALVRAAEAAKKAHNSTTETLLNRPDEHITYALSIAKRAI